MEGGGLRVKSLGQLCLYLRVTCACDIPEVLNLHSLNLQPSTLDPRPSTLNPQPSTLIPPPSTMISQPSTLNLHPLTINPDPSTLDPQPSTCNTQHSTLNLQHSTLPQVCNSLTDFGITSTAPIPGQATLQPKP